MAEICFCDREITVSPNAILVKCDYCQKEVVCCNNCLGTLSTRNPKVRGFKKNPCVSCTRGSNFINNRRMKDRRSERDRRK